MIAKINNQNENNNNNNLSTLLSSCTPASEYIKSAGIIDPTDWEYSTILIFSIYTIVFLVSFFANAGVFLSLSIRHGLTLPQNLFLLNLVFANLLLCVFRYVFCYLCIFPPPIFCEIY